MFNSLSRSRFLATLIATCILLSVITTPVYAFEYTLSDDIDECTLILGEDGNLITISNSNRDGYHTFVEFTPGIYSSSHGYNFTLNHACVLKIMWCGKYTDGSSGTMTATLVGPTTWQEHDFPMDGVARTVQCTGSTYINSLPAGNYNITLMPDNQTKTYIATGSVYSLNY